MAAELRELAAELSADDGLRVVLLTGAGAVFSTGRETLEEAAGIEAMQAARAIASLSVPVLVALNGDATDHGLELALAGDLRVAAAGAKFGFSPPSAGSFPSTAARSGCPGWWGRRGPGICCSPGGW